MKVGIIGNGNHSKRIQLIFKKKKIKFDIYKPKGPKYFDKNEFNNLKKNKIIFILSPNYTHFNYINKLYKNKIIFCEKPAVVNLSELQKLKKIDKRNIYINFNKRFSYLSDIIEKFKKKLGNIVYFSVINSHGLSQLKKYKKSWRAKNNSNNLGTLENVSIHDIDLIDLHFKIKSIENYPYYFSKNRNNSNSCFSKIKLKNNVNGTIFSSYNTSLNNESIFMFQNGYIKQDMKFIKVFYPTKSFDKKGFFKNPPIIYKKKIGFKKDYIRSLEKSLDYFLHYVENSKKFEKKIIQGILRTSKFTLTV